MLIISRTDKWKPDFDEELDYQEPKLAEVSVNDKPTTLAQSELEPVLPLPAVMRVVSTTPVK